MFSIGLVLSAGGSLGDPWHSGVISGLDQLTGWDARTADLIVGTSAGAFAGSSLRAGLSPADFEARNLDRPLSEDGQALLDRITTPFEEVEVAREWRPWSPRMSARALWPPWKADPVRLAYGSLPPGTRSGAAFATRVDELHPDGWPDNPLWIVAVRSDDGRRIVFGRDDVRGTLGQATQASSAIPMFYTPVKIGKREYIDGAVHSSTNADLTAMLGFDLVIVSSVMTAAPDARSWISGTRRAWFSNKLDSEIEHIRSHGTPVVVVEPGVDTVEALSSAHPDYRTRVFDAARATTERVFEGHHGDGIKALIDRATV